MNAFMKPGLIRIRAKTKASFNKLKKFKQLGFQLKTLSFLIKSNHGRAIGEYLFT
jgi:hypothetical protein